MLYFEGYYKLCSFTIFLDYTKLITYASVMELFKEKFTCLDKIEVKEEIDKI